MANSVALNDVVRVLQTELSKDGQNIVVGSTEEEQEVLQKHAATGKRRAAMGLIAGSAACAGVWKALGGQRRLVGAVTMASGGLTGFAYGLLSIRHGLFADILSLPSDKSPFAHRAREILDKQAPNNAFYLEVKQKLQEQQGETGSWDSVPASAAFQGFSTPEENGRGFDRSSSTMPRLPPLPQTDDAADTNDGWSDSDTSRTPSPFFFGGSPSSQRDSSDGYGARLPPSAAKKKPQDEDPYYNDRDGWGYEDENATTKPKPVTWEEVRRRAAGGK